MNKRRNLLPVSFTINNHVDTKDCRFLSITIDVLHTGLNFNGSIFKKDVVDANAESIKNTPVLGYIGFNADDVPDFQGHEHRIVESENGNRYIYAGSAYGVIPESCNYRWITKVCSDGIPRDFFQVDALLWTKFEDAVSIFRRDGRKPQSMELELSSIEGDEDENGIFTFSAFQFNGCCLLSSSDEHIQPAMIDSFAAADYTASSIAREIKLKLEEYTEHVKQLENHDGGVKMNKEDKNEFSLTMNEKTKEINNVLSERRTEDDVLRYIFVDVQDDEIIVMDRENNYRVYGMKFTEVEDKITVDYDSAVRKTVKYVTLEGENTETPPTEFEKLICDISGEMETSKKEIADVKAEYSSLKQDYDEMKVKFDVYVTEEQTRKEAAVEAAKDVEFAKFDQCLSDNEEYLQMKQNRGQYSLDDIKNKCAILFTEKTLKNGKFSKKEKQSLVSSVFEDVSDGVGSSRYGSLPVKK